MKKLNIPLFLLFLVLVSSSLGVFGQFNQLDVEQIKPIESLNTKAEENVPVVNNAGDEIYFMRTYVGKKKLSKAGQQIWSSRFNGEQWESPTEKQLSVNDNANNAVIGISKDHQRIYLFNSLDTRHKLAKGLGYVEMDESGKYSSPIGIDIPGFKVGNGYYSFYVTPDEQQFFIATAHDSTGFEDLFVSLRQADGSWGEIINLGNRINTPTIETTPFLTEDKRILYFSSDGHGGAGQADIFYTERIGESWTEWSKPVNMGSPINSEKFDANFILIDQERAIFSSNRNTDLSDLYEVIFTKKESDTLVEENVQQIAQSAVVFREEQGLMVGKVDLTRFSSSSSAPALLLVKDGNGNVVDTLLVNDQGEFTFESLPTDDYSLSLIGVEDEELIVFDMQDAVIESSPSDSPKGITVVQQSGGLMVGKVDLTRFSSSSSAPALLLVKDGNGNVVDTLLVNDQGEFTFESLPTDDYSLSLIGVEDEELIVFDMQDAVIESSPSDSPKGITVVQQSGGLMVGKVDLTRFSSSSSAPALLLVKDGNGNVVDTLLVNDQGEFTFESLPTDDYSLSLIGVEDEELIVFDMQDAVIESSPSDSPKGITVVQQSGGLMVGKVDLTRFSSSSSAPALLLVKDGNGNVVDTLLVNDQGEFTFESLPTDDYSLSLIGVEDEELIVFDMQDAVIESSPSDSPKGITVVQQSGGLMVGKVDLTRFSSSSSAPALLLVKDGNGNVVDTLLVNDQGEFTFESLPTDDYSLSLIGVEDEELIIFDMQEVKASLFNSKNVNDSAQITSNHSNSIKSASITSTTNKLEKIDEIKVYFGFDSAQIPDTALARINDFLASLRNKTIIKINLTGYTDTSGVSLYNLQLSERRAKSVRDYFVSQGHVEDKIELSGKGEENPDFPNDSREGRILNRRVKVTVSYKD